MKARNSLLNGIAITTTVLSTLVLVACAPSQNVENSSFDNSEILNGIIGGSPLANGSTISKSTVAVYDVDAGALCSGSLIAKDIVVSAAHCVGSNVKSMVIIFDVDKDKILGSAQSLKDILKNSKVRQVQRAVVATAWAAHQNDPKDEGDISVIKFAGVLPAGFAPIDRLKDAKVLKKGSVVTLAGYGITNGVTHAGAGVLRQVQVQISNPTFGATEIEMDQTHGKGACHGDSGGPALINVNGKNFLFGVTSRGEKDPANTCTRFAVYTNTVSYNTMIDKAVAAMSTAK